MGKKTQVAKASLAAAFVAAGGAAATQARADAVTPDPTAVENVNGIVSSYFGQLGLRDDFQQFLKLRSFESFQKVYKVSTSEATDLVIVFSNEKDISPPPGFTVGDSGGAGF